MDVKKLIEQLNEYFEGKELRRSTALDTATALSTFQAKNKKLRAGLKQKSKLIAQQAAELERRDTLLKEQEAELEQVKRYLDEAIKTIFKWTGCPECKYWNSADKWCEKHDRKADSFDGCDSPEWRDQKED